MINKNILHNKNYELKLNKTIDIIVSLIPKDPIEIQKKIIKDKLKKF